MKIAVSADEFHPILETLISMLKLKGHEVIYFGPKKGEEAVDWTSITFEAMQAIQNGDAEEGIVCCWTGTGATLIANKVPGIRAALCGDGETAKGARIWNHANVLGLSLRLMTPEALEEIIEAWLSTPFSEDAWNLGQVKKIQEIESYRFEEPLTRRSPPNKKTTPPI